MDSIARSRRLGIVIALAVYALDQAVKYLMTGPLALDSRLNIHIVSFFDLTWAENYGVSMGMLTADGNWQRWLLVAFTALIAGAVCWWMWRERRRGDIFALALVLGGALGNITDRVRLGYVIDYADLHFGDFRPFLIFNIADAAITIGVIILLARALLMREKDATELETDNA